ncbi:MAG: DUF3488 and transglutaminase-like domain-containing protein [Gammaproteobacteria bacterium]|nr:DUF3488 and transglutaminase-like domain-containing protein [Gammaproteobacteria bacterium]
MIDNHKFTPVLIGIHLVALPMYTRLPPYVLLLIVSFTIWTLLIIAGRIKQPIAFIRILLAFAVIMALLFSYGTILGQEPGTSMLLMLSFLKLFEMKSKRDVLLVIFVGYFLIATNFFHTQSPWIAAYVFIVVIYLTSLLIIFSDRLSSTSFKTRIKISTRMVAQAIPLMLVLFVLFPRIPGPLWSLPKDMKSASTGVGDKMSPGSINDLISSGAVAFRVQFDGQHPEKKDLYWRGLVLSNYDGRTWSRDDAPDNWPPDITYVDPEEKIVEYMVMLEPHGRKWLYSLESPVTQESSYTVTRELQIVTIKEVNSLFSYKLASDLHATNNALSIQEIQKNILLPPGLNEKTIALAKKIRKEAGSSVMAFSDAVLEYFNTRPFYYTLSPPLLGENAMDDFIFSSRQGFCEHYSSAFVYLMRAAGVPARVVIGYQGGTINPVDDYMIVRQSDAHAWAEIWTDNDGWVRVDPTAAVSPDRINYGIANAGLDEAGLPSVIVLNSEFLLQLRYKIDSLNHSWNKWVVGFDEKKQKELFEMLGVDDIDKATLFSWMVVAMTLSGALVFLWVFKQGEKKSKRDVAAYYYSIFCQKFEKSGLTKEPSESADEFLVRIVHDFPDLKQKAEVITHYYQRIRYGDDDSDNRKKQFIHAVKLFAVNSSVSKK